MPLCHHARPLLPLAAALAAGAWLGPGLPLSAAGCLAGLAAGLLLLAWRAAHRRLAPAALIGAAAALGCSGAAVEAASWDANPLRRWALEAELPAQLEGRLAADARERDDHRELLLDVARVESQGQLRPLAGRVRVRVFGQPPQGPLRQGDRLRVWAALGPPRGLRSPGAFDAEAHARRRGVHAHGVAKSGRLLERVGDGAGAVARWRDAARQALDAKLPPGVERALVRAMVLGDRGGIDEQTSEAFRLAGTYHVLALSGAQVALLTLLLLAASRRLGLTPGVEALAVSLCVGFYAAFVGGDVPVVRAAVMAAVLLAGRALDLDADPLNLLALAAGLLLVAQPSHVGDVGFQLSFAATGAILVLTPPLAAGIRRLPLRADLALAVSLGVQAALAPLLIHHFQRLAPAAVLMNLVAAPLSSAVLLAGLAVLLAAGVCPPLAEPAGWVAWSLAHALLRSGALLEGVTSLDLRLPPLPLLVSAAWITGLVAAADSRRRRRGLVLLLAAVVAVVLGPAPTPADGRLHLTLLDVGQGDAVVLQSPNGRTALVDAGPGERFDAGAAVVEPYLRLRGVRRLDLAVLTHPHDDHVGGMPAVLTRFPVAELWHPPGRGPAPATARAAGSALLRGVVRGQRRDWDGVELEVLGPLPGRSRSVNDASVVLSVRLGAVRFLLTGDVSAAAERALAASTAAGLKVAHHGSRSSSSAEFLDSARPEVAIISCGWRNRFGHPHPEVLARLRRRGVRVLRTDHEGSIALATDGRWIWLASHAGARESWPALGR